jgi:predicted O-methyltransferase YrrM
MGLLERTLTSIPGGNRVYYSARWLRRLLRIWRTQNRRFLTFPPGHFASPLPDHDLVEQMHLDLVHRTDLPGIALNVNAQLELLRSLAPIVAAAPFPTHATSGFRYHYENAFFSYGDACYLYGFLNLLKPNRVIEVGSGYSSALMLDTRDHSDWKGKLTFIEPNPTRLNALLMAADDDGSTLIKTLVQNVPLDTFAQLDANDVLFIDSSHVSKIGSDVNYLFFEVLPRLRTGVVIHVHDIFWPFEYPKSWYDRGWAWNEAYLLRALLTGRRYEVLAFPSYLESCHTEAVRTTMSLALQRAATTADQGASSIWLRVRE